MKKSTRKKQGLHLLKSKGKFYWILIARNGRTVARSSEMYTTKIACSNGIKATAKHFGYNEHFYDHTQKLLRLVAY